MSDKKKPITIKPAKPRDPYALDAKTRKTAVFRDKRSERGGTKNSSRDLLHDKDK